MHLRLTCIVATRELLSRPLTSFNALADRPRRPERTSLGRVLIEGQ